MTDAEALDWVCGEFGFDRSKVTILYEIDGYEVNRHHQLRRTGKKIDRRPVYCATDYHYIRFTSGATGGSAGTASSAPSTIDTRPAPEVTRAERITDMAERHETFTPRRRPLLVRHSTQALISSPARDME
ncbi:hypothetical protein AOA80_04665 [Methanomassiliicoccales archaeon RumEn M1]|nr:hypothetical protein AOA80_04665 [Methanomassiliicoccales archaeon RumEn M1]